MNFKRINIKKPAAKKPDHHDIRAIIKETTANEMIEQLQSIFAVQILKLKLQSDNETFTASDFNSLCKLTTALQTINKELRESNVESFFEGKTAEEQRELIKEALETLDENIDEL